MELSPQTVANTSFKTVKKGYDPSEVRSYLATLSKSIESLQSQATAMEARARAAVARLQEIAAQPAPEPAPAATTDVVSAGVEESETISRTLLLAQRTADTTIAEATAEAERITSEADALRRQVLDDTNAEAARMIDEARSEARRAGDGERLAVEGEVQSLLARREFLLSDVDHLELHIVTQRDRLRDVASALTDMVQRVPGGLGDIRRPLMSAVEDDGGDSEASDGRLPDLTGTALAQSAPATVLTDDGAPDPLDDAADSNDTPGSTDSTDSTDVDGWNSDPEPAAEPDTAATEGAGEAVEAADGTPPSGQPNRFLFEDITQEVPRLTSEPAPDSLTIVGDDLR